jgi:hypothetical protein
MDEKIAECGAKGAWAIGKDILMVLATISIGGIHCLFVKSQILASLMLLISGSSEMGGKFAESGAEGAWAI